MLLQHLFRGVDQRIGAVLDLDILLVLAVLFGVRFGLLAHAVNLFFAETARGGDGDLLLLVGGHVLGGYVQDAVGIDIESHLDLGNPTGRGRNADQVEFSQRPVVGGLSPLPAIIGFSDLMKQAAFGPIGSPQYEEFVVDIHTSGTRLLNAINDILEIVSCESGKLELDQKEVGIVDLVATVMKQIAPEAEATGVQILNDVPNDGVCISGDERRLRQALFNLVLNAVKFTEKGGIIQVSMTLTENDGLVLAIADSAPRRREPPVEEGATQRVVG